MAAEVPEGSSTGSPAGSPGSPGSSAGSAAGSPTGGSRGSTPLADRRHPLHVFAARLHARLDELADVEPWAMDASECAETLVEVVAAEARLAGLRARLLARAETLDVAKASSATSTAAWLRSQTRLTARAAKQALQLAHALDSGQHPATAQALGAGRLREDQAAVIAAAVDRLPAGVGPADRARAESHLIRAAADHDCRELTWLGTRLLEVLDPDCAEEQLDRQLQAEEAAARRRTSFAMVD